VQVASYVNHHTTDGRYALDTESAVLPPTEVVVGPEDGSYTYVDESQVQHARYERETETVRGLIEEYAEHDPPPVVIYDGSLTVSFANLFDDETRQRYIDSMAALLARVAPTRSSCRRVHRRLAVVRRGRLSTETPPYRTRRHGATARCRYLRPMLDIWGSRTALFESQRDRSLQKLRTTYRGEEYAFGDRLPVCVRGLRRGVRAWTASKSHSGSVRRMRRPDGRAILCSSTPSRPFGRKPRLASYPEAIQVADSEAVLTGSDRDRLIRMLLRLGRRY